MAEILSTASVICYALAALFLLLAIFFGLKFRILTVVNDLTLRTARRQIGKMREKNERAFKNSYGSGAIPAQWSGKKGQMPRPVSPVNAMYGEGRTRVETGLLDENLGTLEEAGAVPTAYLDEESQSQDASTTLLDNATTLLNQSTMSLRHSKAPQSNAGSTEKKKPCGVQLCMIDEVMLIYTDEVIS
ncbi:MAG: hypothetical protein SOY28_06550 [Roseburia sp.]|nr:hypothetical protein [Roseburia sp.]